jgi:hypothetical protein
LGSDVGDDADVDLVDVGLLSPVAVESGQLVALAALKGGQLERSGSVGVLLGSGLGVVLAGVVGKGLGADDLGPQPEAT